MMCGSFAERDLQLREFYTSSPPCMYSLEYDRDPTLFDKREDRFLLYMRRSLLETSLSLVQKRP